MDPFAKCVLARFGQVIDGTHLSMLRESLRVDYRMEGKLVSRAVKGESRLQSPEYASIDRRVAFKG